MATRLEDKGRKFKRFRHSAAEKAQLSRAGFQHVLSSNVSAIAQDEDDLVIRFHGGATYKYFGKGNLYSKMLQSNSKGRFVWQQLIRKNASYSKVGGVRLRSDSQFTDKDLQAVADRPSKKPIITTLVGAKALKGIMATEDVVSSILATNAI